MQTSADFHTMVAVPTPESVLPLPWMLAVHNALVALLKIQVILVENAFVSYMTTQNLINKLIPLLVIILWTLWACTLKMS